MSHDGTEFGVGVGVQQPVGELLVHVQIRSLPEELDRGVEIVNGDSLHVQHFRLVGGLWAEQPADLLLAGGSRKIFAENVL